MKFPKLKHTVLCQVILYAPAFTLFYYLIVLLLLGWDGPLSWLGGIGALAAAGFSVWYLLSNLLLFMYADMLFGGIRAWRRDRLEYRTFRNGRSRETVKKQILRRCRLWGRQFAPEYPDGDRCQVYYRHGITLTVFHSMVEKRIAICSAEHLTAETYRILLGRARGMLRQVPDGKPRLKTAREKKAPRVYASVVVILADKVEEDVRLLARKAEIAGENEYLLPCVAECPSGAYYLDGASAFYEPGLMGRPAKNYALALLRRLVFGGTLHREDRTKRPPLPMEVDLERSLWDFLREYRREKRENRADNAKERKRMFRRLRDGEVEIGCYAVYCKLAGRLAECAYIPDELDAKRLTLLAGDRWYFPDKALSILARTPKMKKRDIEAVRSQVEAWLQRRGYCVQWEEEAGSPG